MTYGSLNGVGN